MNAPVSAELQRARVLLEQGRAMDAVRSYEQVLERDPGNVEALNVVAMSLLAHAPARARGLLERATQLHPDDALSHHNLGMAFAGLEDWPRAEAAFASAIRLAPESFVSRLHRGGALERLADQDAALHSYFAAIRLAQGAGHWRNAASTNPALRPLVEHAIAFVNRGRRRWFDRVFAPLVTRHGRSGLTRVEACLQVYLGERSAEYADPRQRPRDLYFPGLETSPYFSRDRFAWAGAFESHTAAMRNELDGVLRGADGREPVFHTAELALENLKGGAPKWEGFYFFRHGQRREENCLRCPATAAALAIVPLMHVDGLGPEVMFSVLAPGTHLTPHHGVTNVRVVAHLPLLVPEQCALRVGGETHAWREGQLVFFDDTYEHEAWNRSSQTRVVLILDCWNPCLTDVERIAMAELMVAIAGFDRACAAA